MSQQFTSAEQHFREYLLSGGGLDRTSGAAFLRGFPTDCAVEVRRSLMLLNELGVLEQMINLPHDFPYDDALPVWLEDVRRVGAGRDSEAVLAALGIAGRATGADVRGLLLDLVSRRGGIGETGELRRSLAALCRDRTFLVSVLFRAIDSGVLVELQHGSDHGHLPALRESAIKRLEDSSLRSGLPEWIVDSWLLALGHQTPQLKAESSTSYVVGMLEWFSVTVVSILLCRQLFWYLWGVDEESRWRSGFDNLWWCLIPGGLIGGATAFFASRMMFVNSLIRRLITERSPGFFRLRATFWGGNAAGAVAGVLVAGESWMTAFRIGWVGNVAGLILGTILYSFKRRRAFLYACWGYAAVFAIFLLHSGLYYREDPEHPWLTSHMPGGDAFFLFFCLAAGTAVPCLWVFSIYRAWKSESQHRFLTLREYSLSWDPILAISSRGRAIVWSGKVGSALMAADGLGDFWRGQTCRIQSIAFSPSGALLASAGTDAQVFIWSVNRPEPVAIIGGHWGSVQCLAWSHCGTQLATGAADQQVLVWDAVTWQPLNRIWGLNANVCSLTYAGQDRSVLFAALENGEVCRISLAENCITHRQKLLTTGGQKIAFASNSGMLIVGGRDGVAMCLSNNLQELLRAEYSVENGSSSGGTLRTIEYIPLAGLVVLLRGTELHTWDMASPTTLMLPGNEYPTSTRPSNDPLCFPVVVGDREVSWLPLNGAAKDSPKVVRERLGANHADRIGRLARWLEPALRPQNHVRSARKLLLQLLLVVFCSTGGYFVFGIFGTLPGGTLYVLSYALSCGQGTQFDGNGATRAIRSGFQIGWLAAGLIGAVSAGSACFLSLANHWRAELIRVYGDWGVLRACRWLSLPAFCASYLTATLYEGPIQSFAFNLIFWTIFVGLLGWAAGIWCGIVRSGLISNNSQHQATAASSIWAYSNRFRLRVPHLNFLSIVGAIGLGIKLISFLVFTNYFVQWSIGLFANSGTASGLGTFPNVLEGIRAKPVEIKKVWLEFQLDFERAEEEYVGRNFLIEGIMVSRYPLFRLSSEPKGRELSQCEFGYQDFPLIETNKFLDSSLSDGGANRHLVDGQRVLVSGVCKGLDRNGLVLFVDCRINRSMYDSKLCPEGFSIEH